MAYDPLEQIYNGGNAPLVNESEPESYDPLARIHGTTVAEFSGDRIAQEVAGERNKALLPKTWWGELKSGLSRGVDQLQQTVWGTGALAADALDFDTARDFFTQAVQDNQKEIDQSPGSVTSYDEVDSFDNLMRYVFGSAGEVAPNLVESVITGIAGATFGSAVGPEGAVGGGIAGLVGRKAASNLIKEGVERLVGAEASKTVKNELLGYARGQITRDALQDTTKGILDAGIRNVAGKYGATSALALSSWAQETGSIYNDLQSDPNIAESDRKISALVGGFIAAAPEAVFEGWIASKFFKGAKAVTKEEVKEAQAYVVRFAQNYGKELIKVLPGESGTEFAQTVVEEAAKNWADPSRREAIFQFDEDQKKMFVDASFKGAIGGAMGGGVAAMAESRMPQHPDPLVRAYQRDVMQMAKDMAPPMDVAAAPEDEQLSVLGQRRQQLEAQLQNPKTTDTQKALIATELEQIGAKENELLGEQVTETEKSLPLVNESETDFEMEGINKGESDPNRVTIREGDKGAIAIQTKELPTSSWMPKDAMYIVGLASKEKGVGTTLMRKAAEMAVKENRPLAWDKTKAQGFYEKLGFKPDTNGNFVASVDQLKQFLGQTKVVRTLTPLEEATTRLRAFYAKEMPNRKPEDRLFPVDEQVVAERRAEMDTLVNEITKNHPDPEEAKAYRDAVRGALDDNILNFLARENVQIRQATEAEIKEEGGALNFGVLYDDDSNIVMLLPSVEGAKETAKILSGDATKSQTAAIQATADTLIHEVVHVADFVNIRNQWRKEESILPLSVYHNDISIARGKSLREALPKLPFQVRKVYQYGTPGSVSDNVLGDEFMRMLVEFVRTGQIEEVTQALVEAKEEEKNLKGGAISNFLAKWIDAIRSIRDSFIKMLNPETAPAAFLEDFRQINSVLDKYGVLVNESDQAQPARPPGPIRAPRAPKVAEPKITPPRPPAPPKKPVVEKEPEPTPKVGLDRFIEQSKKQVIPIETAMRRHMEERKLETKEQVEEAAKDFKQQYGKGATLKLYREVAGLVNERQKKKAAKSGGPTNPQGIADQIGIKYDGIMMESIWLFTDYRGTKETNPMYGASIAVPIGSSYETVLTKMEETLKKFENAPKFDSGKTWREGDKGPAKAGRPTLSKRDTNKIIDAFREVNRASNLAFSSITPKEAEERRVQGEIPWAGATPLEMYYTTRPHTKSAVEAQTLVNERGALDIAESLQANMKGEELGITEDAEGNDFGPNATLKAVYENVIRQMIGVEREMIAKESSIAALGYIRDLRRTLESNMRMMGNTSGAYNAYTGMSEKLWDGQTARREYVDTLVQNADKVLGKNSKSKLKQLASELNDLWGKYAGVVVNQPKVIAAIRKIQRLATDARFEKGYRKTVIKSLDKLKAMTKKAAARAADYIAQEEDGEAYVNRAIERMVKEMTGMPKGEQSKTELQLFQGVLQRMAANVGKELGLIKPSPSVKKPSMQEQMAAVLKNEQLYAMFVNGLFNAYVEEYGGLNPEQSFLDEANMIHTRLSARMWQDDMTKVLVNEKMRELNLKMAEIVRDTYARGEFEVDKVRANIASYMKTQGVTNEGLIDQLAQDVEDQMRDNIQSAREKFFTQTTTLKGFLKGMQTTLAQAAKEHSTYVESMERRFEDALVSHYGFPNTDELPIASTLARLMQEEFNELVQAERAKILDRWKREALKSQSERVPTKTKQAVDKVLELANLGAMRTEDVYRALQDKFDLPAYSEETAKEIQDLGDMIGESQYDRQKDILKQKLSDLLTQKKGLKTSDAYVSWMYFSMLSGISTTFVNIGGNLTSMMGYLVLEAIKHPTRVPNMLRAIVRTATGVAQIEARESFFTGYALGKQGEKYYRTGNPAELEDPFFKSSAQNETLKYWDERAAKFSHSVIRGVKGQYVGRALMATDMFFYKIAEEAAYVARVGDASISTPEIWNSAMQMARNEMVRIGQNPDANPDMRRRQLVLAHSIHENLRLRDA